MDFACLVFSSHVKITIMNDATICMYTFYCTIFPFLEHQEICTYMVFNCILLLYDPNIFSFTTRKNYASNKMKYIKQCNKRNRPSYYFQTNVNTKIQDSLKIFMSDSQKR